ncbi:MAG: FAD-binding protein [Terracidiphilus sp.]|nr:FAD-binding protein [Terracidiphilus sp.]MDR3776331.1 FAD-binding protein [Terracidiphilus sp.]
MGTNRFDVVVVGAGLSGLTAAAAAAHQNLKVALVATGPGSFVLGPGWLKAEDVARVSSEPELREAIAFFCERSQFAGCSFAGDIAAARFLPTVLGDFQRVAFAPFSMWNSAPSEGSSTAIVGIRGLSSFDENFMADRLNEHARAMGSSCTYAGRQISLSRNLGIPVTTLRIAAYFDRDPAFRTELIDALRSAASGFTRILVPGMLGTQSSDQQLAQFEQDLGCSLCEMPTLPPSVPGLRVFHRLESQLRKNGVELYRGFPVQKVELLDDSCVQLQVDTPGHPMILRGESVVLATGQYSANLLGNACAGYDEQMRPITSTGSVMAPNLFVAGSLLHSGAKDGGDAMEILTGYRAGNLAASTRGNYAAR